MLAATVSCIVRKTFDNDAEAAGEERYVVFDRRTDVPIDDWCIAIDEELTALPSCDVVFETLGNDKENGVVVLESEVGKLLDCLSVELDELVVNCCGMETEILGDR